MMKKRPSYSQFDDCEESSATMNSQNEEESQQHRMNENPYSSVSLPDMNKSSPSKKPRTKSVDWDEHSSAASSPQNIIRRDDEQQEEPSLKQIMLPDPQENMDPDVFLARLVDAQYGFQPQIKPSLSLPDFFPEISEDRIAAYDMQLVVACRENDVSTLKSLWKDQHKSVDCCNRYGESLLHMACRRGFVEIVEFLLTEANLSVRIRDDCGRTPFHDACWNPQPQLEICKLLIERCPALLLVADMRGSTPFQYARPQHWSTWRAFLMDHRTHLESLKESRDIFS